MSERQGRGDGRSEERAGRETGEHATGEDAASKAPRAVGRSEAIKRVVITSPRTRATTRPRHLGTREINEQTKLGEVYMRLLIRSQLRLALAVCVLVAGTIGGLPVLFTLAPGLGRLRLLGVPLPWVLLAGLVYPMFFGCAWWYIRQAERTEQDFANLVDHRGDDREAR